VRFAGEFHKAFEICQNRLKAGHDAALLSKAIDLALRICDEAILKDMIEISDQYNQFENDKLYFDLYILSNELEHLLKAIHYSYQKGTYKSVIRFYHKEEKRLMISFTSIIIRQKSNLFLLAHNAVMYYENQLQRIPAEKVKETKSRTAGNYEDLRGKIDLVHQYVFGFLDRYWKLLNVFFTPAKELIESPSIQFKIE